MKVVQSKAAMLEGKRDGIDVDIRETNHEKLHTGTLPEK